MLLNVHALFQSTPLFDPTLLVRTYQLAAEAENANNEKREAQMIDFENFPLNDVKILNNNWMNIITYWHVALIQLTAKNIIKSYLNIT